MSIFNFKISSDNLFRLLFHILFWGLLIGGPFLNSIGNEDYFRFQKKLLPVSLMLIPLFFLNSEWLIPSVFRKKGLGSYLLALTGLIIAYGAFQLFLRGWLVHENFHFHRRSVFFTTLFVLLVSAVSTAYGLITTLVDQDKARQEEQQERLKSELAFLRSQISPHFIFNILNSIVYLIRSRSKQAEAVTLKLSELMRYMLYQSNGSNIPLQQELEYLTNYIELQRIRFEEDVDIQLQIEGAPGGQIIEPMLMIPFVENAFKHGVGMILNPIIDITAKIDEKALVFSVKNKIAPEMPEDKDFSSGIGLRNVKRRLELLYPDAHELEIKKEDDWFLVKLQLLFLS